MSDNARIPVFVERRTYRRRRMADAARMLPVLAGLLFCLPLLWSVDGPPRTTSSMFYLFAIWVLLCLVSAMISRRLPVDGTTSESTIPNEGR